MHRSLERRLGESDEFSWTKLADEDGLAIQNGLLYAISKFARFLLDWGLVYIAESPIFEQDGKYFYPSDPRQSGTQFPVGLNQNKHFRRFKGLIGN